MTNQPPDDPRFARRDFILDLAGVLVMGAGFNVRPLVPSHDEIAESTSFARTGNFVGIQMGPHTMLDEASSARSI